MLQTVNWGSPTDCVLFVCFEFKLSVLELAAGVMLGKAPSFSCLTVNNYLAKLLDPGKHQIYAIYSAHASSNLSGNKGAMKS